MSEIKEDYVSFEVAKLLKEKGFNESIRCWYDNFQDFHERGVEMRNSDCLPPTIMCPTYQMAMKWLREAYGIDIIIEISDPSVKNRKYYCIIWDGNNNSYILDLFNTYEEAVDAALKYTLENLI